MKFINFKFSSFFQVLNILILLYIFEYLKFISCYYKIIFLKNKKKIERIDFILFE